MSNQVSLQFNDAAASFAAAATSFPVLTSAQEATLVAQAAAGSKQAADKLLQSNLRIAMKAASAFYTTSRCIEQQDIYAFAVEGLMEGIRTFRPGMGGLYSWLYTYAYYYVVRGLSGNGYAMTMKQNFLKMQVKVRKFMKDYYQRYFTEPSVEEISLGTGLSENYVTELLTYGEDSMDVNCSPDPDHFSNPVADHVAAIADEAAEQPDVLALVDALLKPRSAAIVKSYYGIGGCEKKTAAELAAEYGLTPTRIRQLVAEALKTFRSHRSLFCAA